MSWNPNNPELEHIETLIIPRARDLGGFEVRRALPAPQRQMVGPFIFFDQMGPAEFITDQGIDVRPHPHIGLGTVTYLFQGEFQHYDSLGTNQMIYPGDVNWMVAGRGITHSERTSQATRAQPDTKMFGIQTWVALPTSHEQMAPSFEQAKKAILPMIEDNTISARLILGSAYGEKSPVKTFSEMFYLDVFLGENASMPLTNDHEDRALYVLDGQVSIAGQAFEVGQMLVFRPGDEITIVAGEQGARFMLLGGETFPEPRYIAWNFVASSKELLEDAKQDWINRGPENQRFILPPEDNQEFIPYP